MKIALDGVWLTNDGESDLRLWTDAHDVRLNGKQLVQDAQFLREAAAQPLARGNRVNVLQFTVTRQHASVAAAAAYAVTAFSALPGQGTALVVCGALGEDEVICSFEAVLEEMPQCLFHGTRTDTTFVLRGGLTTTLTPLQAYGVDGAGFETVYGNTRSGTVDGGNMADALVPVGLALDGGLWG